MGKLCQYVKPFSSDTGTSQTDRQTDGRTGRIAISISPVSVLTRDKNGLTFLKVMNEYRVARFYGLRCVFAKRYSDCMQTDVVNMIK